MIRGSAAVGITPLPSPISALEDGSLVPGTIDRPYPYGSMFIFRSSDAIGETHLATEYLSIAVIPVRVTHISPEAFILDLNTSVVFATARYSELRCYKNKIQKSFNVLRKIVNPPC